MSAFIQEHGLLFGWLTVIGQILLFTVVLLLSLAFLLLMDRKVWAAVMMRKGPNVVGPFGLLQSFADFGKFLLKEIIIPAGTMAANSSARSSTRSTILGRSGSISTREPRNPAIL